MANIVFRSCYRRLRVWFPPEIFGMEETAELERDRRGAVVIDPDSGKPYRKMRAHPAAQFEDFMLVLDEGVPEQARMIQHLRDTIQRRKERGTYNEAALYEEDPHVTNLVNLGEGAVIVSVPDVLGDEDKALLFGDASGAGLMTYFHNPLPEKQLARTFDLFDRALERYEVRGIVSPTRERAKKLLRPRIIDLMYALHDAGMPLELENRPKPGTRPEPTGDEVNPPAPDDNAQDEAAAG